MPDRPEVVCLCGSTRFVEQLRAANRDLTFAGVGESTRREVAYAHATGKPVAFTDPVGPA